MTIQRILVATDLSAASDEALKQAARWAAAKNAELRVCHVLPFELPLEPMFPQLHLVDLDRLQQIRESAVEAVEAQVERVLGRSDEVLPVLLDEGSPHAGIVRQAEASEADLIVAGKSHVVGVERVLRGSTVAKVARYAHCPVLVAKPSPPSEQILVATDLSDPAQTAVLTGAAVAKERGAKLTVLHAIDAGFALPTTTVEEPELPPLLETETLRRAAEAKINKLLAEKHIEATVVIVEAGAVPGILTVADRLPAELIVVGTVGRTGLARVTLGNVAESVLRQAPCSTLVVRVHPQRGR